jgi:hypothetical protein
VLLEAIGTVKTHVLLHRQLLVARYIIGVGSPRPVVALAVLVGVAVPLVIALAVLVVVSVALAVALAVLVVVAVALAVVLAVLVVVARSFIIVRLQSRNICGLSR